MEKGVAGSWGTIRPSYCGQARLVKLFYMQVKSSGAFWGTPALAPYLCGVNSHHIAQTSKRTNPNWQVQNRQGDIKNSRENGEAKERICMIHRHELRGQITEGKGVTGWRGAKGKNRDNCNSIIKKIYLKGGNPTANALTVNVFH